MRIINKFFFKFIYFLFRYFKFFETPNNIISKFIWNYKFYYGFSQIIYSAKHKLVYLAIPKVANSSIKNIILMNNGFKANNRKGGLAYLINHSDKKVKSFKIDVKSYYKLRKTCTSFTIIRDPIERLFSFYSTCIKSPMLMKKLSNYYGKFFFYENMSFEKFADSVGRIPDVISNRHFISQHKFLIYNNNLLTKNIFNFNQINKDVYNFLEDKGFDKNTFYNVNRGEKKQYDLNPDTKQILIKRYRKDFEIFKFNIDEL